MNQNPQIDPLSEISEPEKMPSDLPADEMKETLKKIYEALCEKGYDPARQIAGYILSEDPVYITNWKNARGMIGHINRDDLLVVLIRHYLET